MGRSIGIQFERREAEGGELADAPSPSTFLRRRYHSAAIAGDYLYIDGGQVSYTQNGQPNYEIENATLSLDLSKDWTNSTVRFNTITKPMNLPNLNEGVLFFHKPENTIYSGFVGDAADFDKNQAPISPLQLWALKVDQSGGGNWSQVVGSNSNKWQGFVRGTRSLTAQSADSGFSLNGQLVNAPLAPRVWLPGMIELDMGQNTIQNISVTAPSTAPVTAGSLQYVPTLGDKGLLVALGGLDENGNYPGSSVSVYDIANQQWYDQQVSGDLPQGRQWTCTAGVQSPNGTFEIFFYGGFNSFGVGAVDFDDIHILTLPAFHWVQYRYTAKSPRGGHTCHAVGGSQILVVGGSDPSVNPGNKDFPTADQDTMQTRDPWKQGLGIFDLTNLRWNDHYSAKAPPYAQSSLITQYYQQAGKSYQGALNPDLATLLKVPVNTSSSSTGSGSSISQAHASSSSRKSSSNVGAIVGGTIGGVAGVAIIAVLLFLLLFRRRKQKHSRNMEAYPPKLSPEQVSASEMEDTVSPVSRPEISSRAFMEMDGHDRSREMGTSRNGSVNGVHELGGHWIPEAASRPKEAGLGHP